MAVRREEARDHDGGTPPPDGIPAGFHPAGAPVPEVMRTARALLRPLRTTDVDLDYDAVMSSAAELRRCRGSEWPRDGFTLEENLADLERHEREHIERKAFTYTVLNPEGTRCLGCVYIVPVWAEAADIRGAAACAACVGFWVRASEIEHDLDKHLLAVLLEWFRSAWPFDCVLFTNYVADTRQAALLAETGLSRHSLAWPDGRTGSAFRATWPSHASRS